MKNEYFVDHLSDETITKMIDNALRFEKNMKTNKIKSNWLKIISAVAAVTLVIGLINLLPLFLKTDISQTNLRTDLGTDLGTDITGENLTITNNPTETSADIFSLIIPKEQEKQESTEPQNNLKEEIQNQNVTGFKNLITLNSDLYGWIIVKNTTINYPVVQTTDNEYYLYYSFKKTRSPSGAIFTDYRNDRDVSKNRNTLIYGHNMLDNSMFQPLIRFEKDQDLFQNGIIELITETATYYYEIFSAHEEDPASGYITVDFDSDNKYVDFLKTMQNRSVFYKNVTLDKNSKIITLSTCINDFRRDMRFVVQGVLIDVVTVSDDILDDILTQTEKEIEDIQANIKTD